MTVDGIVEIDKFIRYEYLDEDIRAIQKSLGLETGVAIPRRKTQERVKCIAYQDLYDLDTRYRVEDRLAWDLEYFGYSF